MTTVVIRTRLDVTFVRELSVFLWITEQMTVISLHNIKGLLAFITKMERAYCAVRAEPLDVINIKSSL